jgi:hypothetical protein
VLAIQPGEDFLLTTDPNWMETVFPWQTPQPDQLLLDGKVQLRATPGEYEPAVIGVYALEDLPKLRVEVTHLERMPGGEGATVPVVPASKVDIFSVKTRHRSNLGEFGGMRDMAFVPEAWKNDSPELLVPMQEERPSAKRGAHRRFYLDFEVPEDQQPGTYTGSVRLYSSENILHEVPVELEVLPFRLAQTPQRYWMYWMNNRPAWGAMSRSNYRKIAEAGFNGPVMMRGPLFEFSVKDGEIQVDGSAFRRTVAVLREMGLEPVVRWDRAGSTRGGNLLGTAQRAVPFARYLQQRIDRTRDQIRELMPAGEGEAPEAEGEEKAEELVEELKEGEGPETEENLRNLTEKFKRLKNIRENFSLVRHVVAHVDDDVRHELVGNPRMRTRDELPPPALVNEELPEGVTVQKLVERVEELILSGMRKARRIALEESARLEVVVVDEPDGTPERRAGVMLLGPLAQDAGIPVWNVQNNLLDWDPPIDHPTMGEIGANAWLSYPPEVLRQQYEGKARIQPLPPVGAVRAGESHGRRKTWHFDGRIQDVRIYNRALADDEMERQHQSPRGEGLIAHYDFAGIENGRVIDASGEGHHAELINGARAVAGRAGGRALELNGEDQWIQPPQGDVELDGGWSISLWYRGGYRMLFGTNAPQSPRFYCEGVSFRYDTTEEDNLSFRMGHQLLHRVIGNITQHFWAHLTVVFDTRGKVVKAYFTSPAARRWAQDNIRGVYHQVRSMPPRNPRYKMGLTSWRHANQGSLHEVTAFTYGWFILSHLYSVYPPGGDRGAVDWYRTMGWQGVREGIDDARYLQTLMEACREHAGMSREEAVAEVEGLLQPAGYGYQLWRGVYDHFGDYTRMRSTIIDRIRRHKR